MSTMNSIINHILISMPHMQDPFFGNSVVLMCEHDSKGAMGLIVNKPFREHNLSATFDELFDSSKKIFQSVSQIYLGGPVLIERGILLHSNVFDSEDSIKISDDFSISSHVKTLDKLKSQDDEKFSRLLLGHASWAKGQLEQEIENGDWLVQETSPDFIFKIPAEQMWDIAIQSFGIDLESFSAISGKA